MKKLIDILTYHSDDGTSGYYLPDEVLKELKDFIEEAKFQEYKRGYNECIKDLNKKN